MNTSLTNEAIKAGTEKKVQHIGVTQDGEFITDLDDPNLKVRLQYTIPKNKRQGKSKLAGTEKKIEEEEKPDKSF